MAHIVAGMLGAAKNDEPVETFRRFRHRLALVGHADIEFGPAPAEGLADDSDRGYRAVLKDENCHGLDSLPLKSPSAVSETHPQPKGSAAVSRAASGERRRGPPGATTISKSLKGFDRQTGQTNKGRQTS